MYGRLPVIFLCLSFLLSSEVRAEERPPVTELIKMLGSSDQEKRRDAAHQLADYGPEAESAIEALIEALKDRDIQIWHDATQALAHLGPKASPALDALLLGMDSGDEQRRFRTAYALGCIGPAALPAMRERLAHTSGNTREVAVRAIGQMGRDAAKATHELIERLDDKGEHIRVCAVDSLALIGPSTVRPLIDALNHENANIRSGAARTLAAIGPPANESVQRLIERSSSDPQTSVRAAAVAALGRVAPNGSEIIEPLVQALQDDSNVVKRAAVEAWIPVSPQIQTTATTRLSELLTKADAKQRVGILLILNRFGPRAASAAPLLVAELARDPDALELTTTIGQIGQAALEPTYAALREEKITPTQVARIIQGMPSTLRRQIAKKTDDESPIVRELAASTIGDLVPFPRDGVALLLVGLADDVADVRSAAAESIQRVGKKASPIWDELRKFIAEEENTKVRSTMIRALAAMSSKEEELVDCLAENLGHDSAVIKIAALTELSALGELPKTIHETLSELTLASEHEIRALASKSLGLVKEERERSAKLLIALLDDQELLVREQAIRAIAKLGDAAVAALPKIQTQLDSESSEIQVAAIESLAELGKRSGDAIPKIEQLSKHERSDIRESALKSLRKIAREKESIVPMLVAGLQDSEKEIRRTAARELGELEEVASSAVPALLQMLRDDDDSDEARQALREIGTAGEEAVPTFLDILQDKASGRRSQYYSLYLLRKMGKKAESALPILKELREKEDGRTRESFDRAIDAIEEELEED